MNSNTKTKSSTLSVNERTVSDSIWLKFQRQPRGHAKHQFQRSPVEVVEPTGAETITIVRIGNREVIARFEPDAAPSVGETVTLAVDMAKACLFDPETQMLI